MSGRWVQNAFVAAAVIVWVPFSVWCWYRIFNPVIPIERLRVPDTEEVEAALRASCEDGSAREQLTPALRMTPDYPEAARREGIEGFIELAFVVAADGTVADIEVTQSTPPDVFDRNAIHAVSTWRYCPLGKPAPSRIRLAFELDDGASRPAACDDLPWAELQRACRVLTSP